MSLIAAIACAEGLVVSSDTLGTYDSKGFKVTKLHSVDNFIFAICGNPALWKRPVEKTDMLKWIQTQPADFDGNVVLSCILEACHRSVLTSELMERVSEEYTNKMSDDMERLKMRFPAKQVCELMIMQHYSNVSSVGISMIESDGIRLNRRPCQFKRYTVEATAEIQLSGEVDYTNSFARKNYASELLGKRFNDLTQNKRTVRQLSVADAGFLTYRLVESVAHASLLEAAPSLIGGAIDTRCMKEHDEFKLTLGIDF